MVVYDPFQPQAFLPGKGAFSPAINPTMKRILLPILLAFTGPALAQGPLTPPGTPAPTMKTLQEIWDKIGTLETQVTQTQSEIANVRADNQALSGLLAASNMNLPWLLTTVDSVGDVGGELSLAFDSKGKPCIAYYDITNADLKYASLESNGWQVTTLDFTGNVGSSPSLAFGSDGKPSIAYQDVTNSRVKYANHDGSNWQFTIVAEVGANLPSLAFGPNGKPAIAYRLGTSARLARFDETWITEAVSVATVLSKAVLAFDSRNGMPVVAYQLLFNQFIFDSDTYSDFEIEKAVFNGVTWDRNVMLTNGSGGYAPSIKSGPNALPAVAHTGANTIIEGAGIKFENSFIGPSSNFVTNTSLAFGVNGHPSVSYYQTDTGDLKLATFNGSTWVLSVVDNAGDVGLVNSLAFGLDGQPAIAYYDTTNGNLKFARKGLFRSSP